MKITKESFKILVRQMIKEETTKKKKTITEQLLVEGAPKLVKSGERVNVENPDNFQQVLVSGFGKATFENHTASPDIIQIRITSSLEQVDNPELESKLELLGVVMTDKTAQEGIVLIEPNTSTISKITSKYGNINQKIHLYLPDGVTMKQERR